MNRFSKLFQWAVVMLLLLSAASPAAAAPALAGAPAPAGDGKTGYQTGLALWREFSGWTLTGTQIANGGLQLASSAKEGTDPYPAGGYNGKNYYNGGAFLVGEATSPLVTPGFNFSEAIASWNADTPPGTWIETQILAKIGARETKWYSLGIWASDNDTVERHSVNLQGDADGYVAVDTLVLAKGKVPASALQVKVRLFVTKGVTATPTLRSLSLAYSPSAPKKVEPSTFSFGIHHALTVEPCSQMVYSDGGNVWCSPTSTSMVLGYWGVGAGLGCEKRVRDAVAGTYDWIYDGNGNWPFNPAYAQSAGYKVGIPLEGFVVRYNSIAQLEQWIAGGVPVVMSIAWNKGDLTNAPVNSSNGHLIVLTGFDENGNALVNDPAANGTTPEEANAAVPRTYLRSELENVWLTNSGGVVYLIMPVGWKIQLTGF